jgi:hypothetical protein
MLFLFAGMRPVAAAVNRRSFRADATIYLFSIPVWRQSGVGSGFLALEERPAAQGTRFRAEFAAGANPARAKGLRHVGWLTETAQQSGGALGEAEYFGFMTSFQAEGVDQARRVLSEADQGAVRFSASEGARTPQQCWSRTASFEAPPPVDPRSWGRLAERARHALGRTAAASADPQPAGTLLHTLYRFAGETGSRSATDYLFNGRRYRVEMEKSGDPAAGRQLAARGLTAQADRVMKLSGRAWLPPGGSKIGFAVWYAAGEPQNVLRIEWQPRSFLRLHFEVDANLSFQEAF